MTLAQIWLLLRAHHDMNAPPDSSAPGGRSTPGPADAEVGSASDLLALAAMRRG